MTEESRIVALEEALANAAAELQDVSDMVARQWAQIDILSREIERLARRLAILEEKAGDR